MSNDFYTSTGSPTYGAQGASAAQRNQFSLIEAGFDLFPALSVLLVGLGYSCTTAGAADAYTATISNKIVAYTDHLSLSLKVHATNTGATTINVNGMGLKSIKRYDGNALSAGDMPINSNVIITYNTTLGYFTLQVPTISEASIADITIAALAAITPLNLSRATVASHATTAAIWAAAGNQIDFTGTATVTAFPAATQAGSSRTLICAGACSFTAGANMLIQGYTSGQTVTMAANDKVIVEAITTTQFLLTIERYSGAPETGTHRVVVHTGDGFGSTNTAIRKFTTAAVNTGTAIVYATSAANGASFTIAKTGLYWIRYTELYVTGVAVFGATVNSAQLTTAFGSLSAANRLYRKNNTVAGDYVSADYIIKLTAGDVVRPHAAGNNQVDADDGCGFEIMLVELA